jgi:hypothetical protein
MPCLGVDRIKEANALNEFESITFHDCEEVDDFAIRITNLCALGETSVDDVRVVNKFLCVVPTRYNQVAVAIKMFYDLKDLSID